MKLSGYRYNCDLELDRFSFSIRAYPENSEIVRNFYSEVHSWIKTIEPPSWKKGWVKTSRSAPILFFVWLNSTIFLTMFSTSESDMLQKQIRELMQGGVTPVEKDRALDLLLRLNDGQTPAPSLPSLSFIITMSIFFVLCLVLSFPPPQLIVGIGQGKDKVEYWKRRLKFTFVSVPTFIALTFILPIIIKFWEKLFPL